MYISILIKSLQDFCCNISCDINFKIAPIILNALNGVQMKLLLFIYQRG